MIFKSQVTAINITVVLVSVGTILFLGFSKIRSITAKTLKHVESHVPSNLRSAHSFTGSKANKAVLTSSVGLPIQIQIPRSSNSENFAKKIPSVDVQKQPSEPPKMPEKPEQPTAKSNGCPKNLAYFAMRPRPKQTPEECFSCKKLIECTCLTSE